MTTTGVGGLILEVAAPLTQAQVASMGRVTGFVARNKLKIILVACDLTAILLAYTAALWKTGYFQSYGWLQSMFVLGASIILGFWAIRSQELLLARVSAVRVVEITRATRAIAILGALMLLFDRLAKISLRIEVVATATLFLLVTFVIGRSGYRAWLSGARAKGRHCRRVVVIGADHDAVRIVDLVSTHGDLGIVAVGVIADRDVALVNRLGHLWLGETLDTEELITSANVSGVIVSPTGLPLERLNSLIRHFQHGGVHVFVATGFSGIDARRVRSLSIAHEPMLYVEAPSLARLQTLAKRAFDIVVALVALALASPIILLVAAGVKLTDRGPVLFRQQRVGHDGRQFGLLKFRTMVVDAERQLVRLEAANERRGPLFKMVDDPRVTRLGRFLRESSLDELPQLLNVLTGKMSLVGPRPALPSEVEQFSDELRTREDVMPGITGLWQVEARDNPSFEAYRRLDLFYVENWSLTLDMLIILGTIEQVLVRFVVALWRGARRDKIVGTEPLWDTEASSAAA